MVWSLVMHPRLPDGLSSIRAWSWRDVVHAHAALDAQGEIDAFHRASAQKGAR